MKDTTAVKSWCGVNRTPTTPTKAKHIIYLIASTVLGILLSYLAHAGLEYFYLRSAESAGTIRSVQWSTHFGLGSCALPEIWQYSLFAAGLVGGYFLGVWWWRIVYIERRWWRN